jgi:predicted ATPase
VTGQNLRLVLGNISESGDSGRWRAALVEAAAQFARALDQIAALPATPALRREEIRLQVALIIPLQHVKGYAAPQTKAAIERASLLIEQAEGLGEPLEDPLILFSVLYSLWYANYVAFSGDVMRGLAEPSLALAEKQGSAAPLMIGHRLVGTSLLSTGDIAEARTHFDRAITLYEPTEHRPLAARFGQDVRGMILFQRSFSLWFLGYPEAALADVEHALKYAREIGQAATLFTALLGGCLVHIFCGNCARASSLADELFALADEKDSRAWKPLGMMVQGYVLGQTGKASEAAQMLTSGITAHRSNGATLFSPVHLSCLARAHAELGQFDDAWRCIAEAMEVIRTTKEKWHKAEVNRIAGEIALISPEPGTTKAETHFERALSVARQQQAKSWELRAAMSLARLWRDQGKVQQARELLAPIYAWFTEGFDTRDLKEAKALLEELAG